MGAGGLAAIGCIGIVPPVGIEEGAMGNGADAAPAALASSASVLLSQYLAAVPMRASAAIRKTPDVATTSPA
jgi:hypothetical protein